MEAVGALPPRPDAPDTHPPRPGAVVVRIGLACLAPTMIVAAGWLRSARSGDSESEPQAPWPQAAELDLAAPSYVDAYPQGRLLDAPYASTAPAPPWAGGSDLVAAPAPARVAAARESRFLPCPGKPAPSAQAASPQGAVREAWGEDEASFALRVTPTEALAYTPVSHELSRSLAPKVQQGFQLGKSGALFAARAKFIGVLREIAAAKDAAEHTTQHVAAVDEGLVALEESEDFVNARAVGGGPVDVRQLAQSHQTPLIEMNGFDNARETLPHEAAAMYHRYGEAKLGGAVVGEQAGSMALFGLGKTYARLAEREEQPGASAQSLSYFRAATIAHPGNHMAANEIGVHLARAGHYDESYFALASAVPHNPDSNIFRNLAVVERSLGRPQQALAAQARADELASAEKSTGDFARSRGVQWVDPAQFQSTTPSSPGAPAAQVQQEVAQQPPAAPAGGVGPIRSALGWGAAATPLR